MGNFGKRILITFLAVLVIVVLALGGNAIQQRDKSHKVSNAKQVVYSGTYNGLSYEITKKDVWTNMLYSSPMSTVNEMIDRKLLASFIENANDATKLANKKNYLIYGTTDEESIKKQQENVENNEKLLKSFENRLTVLGYTENGAEGHTINDYLKLMVAYDDYAAYRINEGLSIGSLTADLSEDTLISNYKKGYKDTLAVAIKFSNNDEAKSVYKAQNLAVVGSRLRYYVGNEKYVLAKDDDGSYYLNDDFTVDYYEMEVTLEDESKVTVKVPNGNVKMVDGEYVWDNKRTAWTIDGDTTEYHFVLNDDVFDEETDAYTTEAAFVSAQKEYDDVTSFTTSNTAVLSPNTWMILYTRMYNEVYSQTRTLLPTAMLTEADFYDAMSLDHTSGKVSDADMEKMNAALKNYGLVLVNYTIDDVSYQQIRKYVGDSEYVLKVEDGKVVSKDGYVSEYKKFNDTNIPNYKLVLDDNGDPVLDSNNKFQYILDENGERVPNDSKKSINDQTTFDLTNTIECNQISLYSAYLNMYNDYEYAAWDLGYETLVKGVYENLLYKYSDISSTRSNFATQVFSTLTYDESATGSYLAQPTSISGSEHVTPYYLIMKLGSSTITEDPSEEKLAELKEEKIKEYLETSGVVTTALAELRKEAGLVLYDEYFGYEYKNIISNNSSSNTYGPSDTKDYYKVKSYKAKILAQTTKEVSVNGNKVAKMTITADDLYDFSMSQSASSFISTTALNKVLLTMEDFAKIHGKSTNYLTSKNWKMVEYAEATQNYNYYYEYYASLYKQYGYDYYDSINQFLYEYGSRNFDDMVLSFERGTMRNVFIYNALVGDLFANTSDQYLTTLSSYATTATDPTGNSTDKYLFNSEKFTDLFDKYFSINVDHVLISVDFDEDGSPDDYNKFLETFDETTGESSFLRKADQTTLTKADWDQLIKKLESKLYDFIDQDENWGKSNVSDLDKFVDEYLESSIVDGDYKEFKKVGITVKYESLGEVTPSNKTNYVKEFQDGIDEVYEKLARVDKELLGYSMSDKLTKTEFGLHFIVETAGSNYDKINFKYTDDNYGDAAKNDNENVSDAQIALYILQKVYTNIFGDTDNPEKNAGFNYPTLPASVTKAFAQYYDTYINSVLDTSNTYHSNYIMLLTLVNENSQYTEQFKQLLDIYYSVLFGVLA